LTLEALIFARVAQGAFGAPIMPLGQAILLATFPKHLQPAAIVMWGIGAVFGPVLGPILGSIATDAYDWRAEHLPTFDEEVGLLQDVEDIAEAADLFREMIVSDDFVEFLTLPAYERLG